MATSAIGFYCWFSPHRVLDRASSLGVARFARASSRTSPAWQVSLVASLRRRRHPIRALSPRAFPSNRHPARRTPVQIASTPMWSRPRPLRGVSSRCLFSATPRRRARTPPPASQTPFHLPRRRRRRRRRRHPRCPPPLTWLPNHSRNQTRRPRRARPRSIQTTLS